MKQSLQLRVSQQLTLTPQLQQSIRLLQLSTLELQQELDHILSENPLLERLDDPMSTPLRLSSDGTMQVDGPSTPATDDNFTTPPDDHATDAAAPADPAPAETPSSSEESFEHADHDPTNLDFRRSGSDDDESPLQIAAHTPSLREHLLTQLGTTSASMRDKGLVSALIEALDDNGYLTQSLEDIAAYLPAEYEFDPQELSTALKLLQSFDPVGVGARDCAECLLLQLRAPDLDVLVEARDARVLAIARQICEAHLALLAQRDYTRLKRQLDCGDDDLRAAHQLILRLDPRPGSAFGVRAADYVTPDVVVRKIREQWVAVLNSDVMPQLRINQAYARILKQHRASGASMSAQLQEARWIIRNVQQRFETILRVAQAIVDRQKSFFNHGAVAMRPLVLREIADTLGLHESTVSRVTSQKYMYTPFGTFELKYFFGSHVATESGGAASSTALRALIKQLIDAEDSKKPLSDNRIAELLGEQGFVIARRTVAKYRESLKIPALSIRKTL